MNLFYIKNKLFNVLILVSQTPIYESKEINGNYFFYDSNKQLCGFNIFNPTIKLSKPGRMLIDQNIINELNNIYNLNLSIDSFVYFRVVKIADFEPIEKTHLSKCKVDCGNNHYIQVICGAKNVKKDMLTVLAPVGIVMNNGLFIKPSKLQSFDSFGMLCSQKELDLVGFNDTGIIELDQNKYKLGDCFFHCYQKYE